MFVDDDKREINFKLVYLGPDADLAARYVQTIHGRVAPALRSELRLLRGDGEHVSTGVDVFVFDFTPALKNPGNAGLRSRLHLYALRGTPTAEDRAFVLRGVDAVLLVLTAASAGDGSALQAIESDIADVQPRCVFVVADESGGAHDTTHPRWPALATNVDSGAGVLDTVKAPTQALLEAIRDA